MLDKHVVFLEAALIEEDSDALTGGQLALSVLAVDSRLPAAHPRLFAFRLQCHDQFVHVPALLRKSVQNLPGRLIPPRAGMAS